MKTVTKGGATLTTKAVAWAGDIPTKYQSALEYKVSDKRIIRISGDPMPNKEKALDSLATERVIWNEALHEFNNVEL